MAVYKSQREESLVGYLKYSHDLRLITMRIVKKFPTSYRWIFTNNVLDLAVEIFTNCIKGESIKIDLRVDEEDFKIRHEYFMKAKSACEALLGEITFAYELSHEGNNFFEGKKEYSKKFQRWSEVAVQCLDSITHAIEIDNRRQHKRVENKKQYNGSNGTVHNRPRPVKPIQYRDRDKKKTEKNLI